MDNNDPHFQKVQELLGLRFNPEKGNYEVKVKWQGFDYEEPTWEPFGATQEGIPTMLDAFLRDYPDQEMARRAKDNGAQE